MAGAIIPASRWAMRGKGTMAAAAIIRSSTMVAEAEAEAEAEATMLRVVVMAVAAVMAAAVIAEIFC